MRGGYFLTDSIAWAMGLVASVALFGFCMYWLA